jgi:hypothetical protein
MTQAQEYYDATSYVIMNEEEYKQVRSHVLREGFPSDPPCGFPMLMIRVQLMENLHPDDTRFTTMTTWIGISASDIKKIISPYLPGKGMFGPIEFTAAGVKSGRTETDKENKANEPKSGDQVLSALRVLAEQSRATADLWNTLKGAVGNALKQASDDIATEMFTLLEENGYEIVKKGGTSVADKAIRLIASSIARPEYTTEVEWALNLAQMLVDQCLRCKGNWTDIRIMRSGIIEVK